MSVNGEIHNAYSLYIITNIVTILPSGNTEETLKTAYYKSKDSCKKLNTDWLKVYRMQMRT